MRLAEYALLLSPLLFVVAWWLGAPMISRRMLLLAALVLAGLGATLLRLDADRSFTGGYVPAHLKGEQVVPGHSAAKPGT